MREGGVGRQREREEGWGEGGGQRGRTEGGGRERM